MREHKCIICGNNFESERSFCSCPKCGSLGTSISVVKGESQLLKDLGKIYNKS